MVRRPIWMFAVAVLVATPKPSRAQPGARTHFSRRWISIPLNQTTQTASPTSFLTTIAKDTFGLEQYSRVGNVISGTWVVLHPPGVYVHDYRITLGDDGLPARYTMRYSTPGAMSRPDLDSVVVVYSRDSAALEFYRRDSSLTRRIAIHEGFPLLGQSFVGVELALMRLRSIHVDSSSIALHPPSDPAGQMTRAPVRFFAGDSALLAGAMRIHVDSYGRILGLRSGPLELKRVEPFDMTSITDGFVKAFAPRVAAQAAAAASRVEIALSAAQLERFVGDYSNGPATISIAQIGEHLVLELPRQQGIQLLAMSATDFFVRKPDLVVAFETDTVGRVAALTLQQGETKQRFIRKN
jgi:uncharacterized protein DUF3471